MMALAAAALTEPDLPAAAQHRLEQIVGQAEWLSDMIRNCLPKQQWEEPEETGKSGRAPADVAQIVGEVIEAERLTWPGDMKLVAPAKPVRCMVDPVLLRRAVSNALGNAVRAAGPAGTVSVEVRQFRAPQPRRRARPLGAHSQTFGIYPNHYSCRKLTKLPTRLTLVSFSHPIFRPEFTSAPDAGVSGRGENEPVSRKGGLPLSTEVDQALSSPGRHSSQPRAAAAGGGPYPHASQPRTMPRRRARTTASIEQKYRKESWT
jgi:hypothetical protein